MTWLQPRLQSSIGQGQIYEERRSYQTELVGVLEWLIQDCPANILGCYTIRYCGKRLAYWLNLEPA
ncbi:hypothetical protein FOXYSP1_19437 [Fusarium oxysporum f. sp. phaseoli]